MKNSFNYLLILLLLSCSTSSNEQLVDIKSFKNDGKEIFLEKKKEDYKNIKKITQFSNYKSFDLKNWNHINFQSTNFLPHTIYSVKLSLLKKNKFFLKNKSNIYEKNLLSFNNKIFYIDDFGYIYTLDLNLKLINKFALYKKKIKNYHLKFAIVANNNKIFIADNLGNIFSYDTDLNKIIWSISLGVPFISNLIIYDDNIYAVNNNAKIFSFNSQTGKQNWSFETATNIIKDMNAFQISAGLNKLIFSNDLGDIYCIDLVEKKLLWSFNIEASVDLKNSNDLLKLSKIIIKDEEVFLSTNKKKILKLDVDSGSLNWLVDLPSQSTVTSLLTPDYVINITQDGYLSIINKNNGNIMYRINISHYLTYKDNKKNKFNFLYSFISSNFFYFVTDNGFFFKINSNNLEDITYKKVAKNISSSPIIISNNLYFLDYDGLIHKIN